MRTTIDLDDDLLPLARQLAQQRHMTMGQVVSELMRKGLAPTDAPKMRNGIPLFTPVAGAAPADLTLINKLRDE